MYCYYVKYERTVFCYPRARYLRLHFRVKLSIPLRSLPKHVIGTNQLALPSERENNN